MVNSMRILLVEDNIEDADLTMRFFRKNNVPNLVHTSSVDEACKVLETLTISDLLPRIMLVDLGLPGIKGVDLIRKVKVDDKLKNIKIVVLTGSQSDQDIIDTFKLRVDAHLIKPLDVFKLRKILTLAEGSN